MEQIDPHIVLPESAPEKPEAPKKKSAFGGLFDLFTPKEEETKSEKSESAQPEKKSAQKADRLTDDPTRTRRFAAELLLLLRHEPTPETPEQPQPESESPTPEVQPEPPTLVERAKEMGRGVLRLIRQVRQDVQVADVREDVIEPTDLLPLAEADADVRAAMQELIAPIEAVAHEHDSAQEAPAAAPESSGGGTDYDYGGGDASPLTTIRKTVEAAAVTAITAAGRLFETAERPEPRRTVVKKMGLLVLGATLVATWHRQHELKKENRALRKEHQRFETEVRQQQERDHQRIVQLEQLEQTNVETLNQPQRQEYVQEVSQFAHAQAAEIRTVAAVQEQMRARVVEQRIPAMPPAENMQPASAERAQPLEPVEVFSLPAEHRELTTPEAKRRALVVERTPKPSGIERLKQAVTGEKPRTASTSSGGVGGGLFSVLPAPLQQLLQPNKSAATVTPTTPVLPHITVQGWLFGIALALGIVVVLVILIGLW